MCESIYVETSVQKFFGVKASLSVCCVCVCERLRMEKHLCQKKLLCVKAPECESLRLQEHLWQKYAKVVCVYVCKKPLCGNGSVCVCVCVKVNIALYKLSVCQCRSFLCESICVILCKLNILCKRFCVLSVRAPVRQSFCVKIQMFKNHLFVEPSLCKRFGVSSLLCTKASV